MLVTEHMSKIIHSVFYNHIEDNGLSKSLTFSSLQSAGHKSVTAGFVFACQNRVMKTLVYRQSILQTEASTSYRLNKSHPETSMHVLSACPTLCQTGYIYRYNCSSYYLFFSLRHYYGIDTSPILPYVPTDIERVIQCHQDHMANVYAICSAICNIKQYAKEDEKRSKYRDLLSECQKLYSGYKVKLVVQFKNVL